MSRNEKNIKAQFPPIIFPFSFVLSLNISKRGINLLLEISNATGAVSSNTFMSRIKMEFIVFTLCIVFTACIPFSAFTESK